MKRIDCFIPFVSEDQVAATAANLSAEAEVSSVNRIDAASFRSTAAVRRMAATATAPYTMIYTKTTDLSFGNFALERLLSVSWAS